MSAAIDESRTSPEHSNALESATSGNRLTLVQAGSGLIFGAFVAVHLVNTWLGAWSSAAYDGFQSVAQMLYQFWLVEVLIVVALVVHAICGVVRLRQRAHRTLTPRQRWHRYSGLFLLMFVFGHLAAVRGPSLFAGVYPEAAGLQFSIAYLPAWFYPYYFLLAAAGLLHGWRGAQIAYVRLAGQRAAWLGGNRAAQWVPIVGAVFSVAALLGFGGWWYELPPVSESAYGQFMLELFGMSTQNGSVVE